MAAGKFVIKKGRSGQFRFSLVGRNSQTVATRGATKTAAQAAKKAIAKAAPAKRATKSAKTKCSGERRCGTALGTTRTMCCRR